MAWFYSATLACFCSAVDKLGSIETFTGTRTSPQQATPATQDDDDVDQREVIATMLGEMASALMKAAAALRLQ